MRGASTLTQQLIKNLYFTTHRNPVRKAYEWALTPPAEWILGKDRILELYVNVVEFGPGIYGAEAAARHHYGIGAGDCRGIRPRAWRRCCPPRSSAGRRPWAGTRASSSSG
jgi:monofunctional glycosyltransferase